jgi:hypothetical protein
MVRMLWVQGECSTFNELYILSTLGFLSLDSRHTLFTLTYFLS